MSQSMSADEFKARKGKKRTKYKAVRTNGFASKAEAEYYATKLRPLEKVARCISVEKQPRFNIGCPVSNYVADFKVKIHDTGEVYIVDVKGMETPKFKHDKKLWRSYGPHPLHIVKRVGKRWETTVIPRGTKINP